MLGIVPNDLKHHLGTVFVNSIFPRNVNKVLGGGVGEWEIRTARDRTCKAVPGFKCQMIKTKMRLQRKQLHIKILKTYNESACIKNKLV